ncbi:MAG: RNA-binding S4 domain-containing protein [Sphingomonadales bacterium]|nr:RNA-binding S4 domain-containing protein [Sphingomonadales bacterium]
MRVDRLLWFLRLAKTRGAAQALVAEGHMRVNGRRIERAAHPVNVGDVMVLPAPHGVRIIELLAVPARRGPAVEAQSCYRVLDEGSANPIAGAKPTPEGTELP